MTLPDWRPALAVALVLVAVSLIAPAAADARFATGGTGTFVEAIDWLEWGAPFAWLGNGPVTRTSTTTVGGADLVVSCTLSNFGGVAEPIRPGAYRAGDWSGDALDDLYNIGGAGLDNQLVNGIFGENVPPATIVATVDFACGATLGGAPLALRGVVFADAEQANAGEYIEGGVPLAATWRIIERIRAPIGCLFTTRMTRTDASATTTLRLSGDDFSCDTGPAAVAFADGASSGRLAMLGGGKSAAALGVMVAFDRGDAPASYGDAVHALQPAFSGGELPVGGPTSLFDPFTIADTAPPPTRLGASVDPGGSPSADAGGDDGGGTGTFGPADDESEGAPASIAVWPGTTYTRSAIACTGPGTVAGWIDFDASGTFDSAERSQSAPCTGSAVDLTWTVPPGARAQASSFMRLRIAAAANEVADATGVARSGEVEDHALAIDLVAPTATTPPGSTTALPPVPTADLAVLSSVDRKAVAGNRQITWRATVTNRGTADASGVVLRAQPSSPVAFTLVRAAAGRCTKVAPVRCELGTIAPGATATVTLIGRARVAGALRTTLRVAADGVDPTPSDNVASTTTSVRGTLRLGVMARESSVRAGGLVRYLIRVSNPSLVGVQRVRVCDRLPRGLAYVSSSRRAARVGGRLCWNLGTVARTSSKTVRIVGRARRAIAAGATHSATVSGRGAPARTVTR